MINYEHVYKGVDIINEFCDKLAELCKEYQGKLKQECPEDIGLSVMRTADSRPWIQLSDNRSDEKAYTEEELVADGFEFDFESKDCRCSYYKKVINGVEVICAIDK